MLMKFVNLFFIPLHFAVSLLVFKEIICCELLASEEESGKMKCEKRLLLLLLLFQCLRV